MYIEGELDHDSVAWLAATVHAKLSVYCLPFKIETSALCHGVKAMSASCELSDGCLCLSRYDDAT